MAWRIYKLSFPVLLALLLLFQIISVAVPDPACAEPNVYEGPNGEIYMGDSLPRELMQEGYVLRGSKQQSLYPTHGRFKDFLWKIASGTTTVYILGSVHIAKKNIYPLPANIENAFNSSGELAVEANITTGTLTGTTAKEILRRITYSGGDTLKKHISPRTYALVKGKLSSLGLSMDNARILRPWALALTIESLSAMGSGYSANYGIDEHFIEEAQGSKRIVELEGVAFQLNLFKNMPDKEAEAMLLATLQAGGQSELDSILSCWAVGDAGKMDSLINGDIEKNPDLGPFYKKLLWDRNRGMAAKIAKFLKGNERMFIVVGAAHLVGDKGVLALLRQKGYRVEQMDSEAKPAKQTDTD